jgi:uncharacterized protein YebE (UPF0316 family)
MELALLFGAGFLQDILVTSSQKCIHKAYFIRAAILSSMIGVLSILVISSIVAQMQVDHAVPKVLAFAIGKGIGTFTSLKVWHSRRINVLQGSRG